MKEEKLNVIFVAGSSYSGSTLLGLILGSDKRIFNAGEISKYKEIKEGDFKLDVKKEITTKCTCGKEYEKCPFWKEVNNNYSSETDLNPGAGFSKRNLWLMFRILNPFYKPKRTEVSDEYYKYIKTIFSTAKKFKKDVKYVLDDSKSVSNLEFLLQHSNINVKVIHLVRDSKSTMNSFRKHGLSVLYGIISWVSVNYFILKLSKKTKVDYKRITYDHMCLNPQEVFEELNNFLGTTVSTKTYKKNVQNEDYHIVAGNPFLNSFKDKSSKFEGIKYQKGTNRLTKLQSFFSSIVLYVPSKVFSRER